MLKAVFPYCYRPSLDQIYPRQNRSREEIDHLHDRIREPDKSVAEFPRQRAALLQKLNDVQPPISILPIEALSLVFQLACPPPVFGSCFMPSKPILDRDDVSSVLSNVSMRWRQTLLSTPQLWTSINLCITNKTVKSEAASLSQLLNNSGSLPLTLSLFYDRPTLINTFLHETIDAKLLQNFSRIRNLHLRRPPSVWLSHSAYLDGLTHLSIDELLPPELDSEFALIHSPNLRQLTLVETVVSICLPSPCLVTVLELVSIPLDTYFQMLAGCPNLVELHAGHLTAPRYVSNPSPEEGFTLKHLEVFELLISFDMAVGEQWQNALLNRVSLPSLRTLRWMIPYGLRAPTSRDIVGNFFASLLLALTTLELSWVTSINSREDFAAITRYLHSNTCIEHLALIHCESYFVLDVLRELAQREGARPRFPRLRSVILEGIRCSAPSFDTNLVKLRQDTEEELSHLLVEMLETRMIGSDHNFVLDLKDLSYFEGYPLIQQELVELRNRGCRLEILIDSILLP